MTARKKVKLTAFIDGASRGNPGPASVGVVIQDASGKVVRNISSRIGVTTNNVAEYFGLIFALQEALALGAGEVAVFTDSELLARQFNGEYKIKEDSLKLLSVLIGHLRQTFSKVTVQHVPREKNKLADAQANRALDQDLFLQIG